MGVGGRGKDLFPWIACRRGDILFQPTGELRERHNEPGTVFGVSPYTAAVTLRKGYMIALGAALLGVGGALW